MSFPVEEGLEGYFLITAHMLMSRGYITPLTLRYLALSKALPVAAMMRAVLHGLCEEFVQEIPGLNSSEKMRIYECRSDLFVTALTYPERTYACITRITLDWIDDHIENQVEAASMKHRVSLLLMLDQAFAPRTGKTREITTHFEFDANAVMDALEQMDRPDPTLFADQPTDVGIHIPGGVGDIIKDPDGGVWIHAERTSSKAEHDAKLQPVTVQSLAVSA